MKDLKDLPILKETLSGNGMKARVADLLGISRQAVFLWTKNGLPWGGTERLAKLIAEQAYHNYPAEELKVLARRISVESTNYKKSLYLGRVKRYG